MGNPARLAAATLAICAGCRFSPPDADDRRQAIGDVSALEPRLQRAFAPEGFLPVPPPGPNDWLARHWELGQTFGEFAASGANRPDAARRKLYLLPLGRFGAASPSLELLADYASAYFGLPVVVLPTREVGEGEFSPRVDARTGSRQLLSRAIRDRLGSDLPPDAFALVGVTMEDLYPSPSWNFVFGEASLEDRVGVFGFARFAGPLQLRRSLKLLTHETGHLFGMRHCVHFSCNLNGTNHLEETDAKPLELCPVCLRKLHSSVGFDVAARYRRIAGLLEGAGLTEEAAAAEARLRRVEGR